MAKGYMLDEQAMRKTAAMVRRLSGTPRTGQGLQPNSFFGQDRLFVGGKVYGATLPASTSTKPGAGEFIIDQIELTGPSYVRPDTTNPQKIINTSTRAFAVGDRVRAWLDTAALHSDSEQSGHTAVWVTGDDQGSDAVKGAFSIGGEESPRTTGSGTNLLFAAATLNDTLVSFEAGMPADTYVGVKIEQRGRWAIFTHCGILSASAPNDGTILMTDGVDLLTKFLLLNGTFSLTVNDNATAPTGGPSLASRFWMFENWSAGAGKWHDLSTHDIYWLEANDVLRLYFEHTSFSTAGAIGLEFGIWGFYYGDYATEWTPDS